MRTKYTLTENLEWVEVTEDNKMPPLVLGALIGFAVVAFSLLLLTNRSTPKPTPQPPVRIYSVCGLCGMEIDTAKEVYLKEYLTDPRIRIEVKKIVKAKYKKK